MEHAGLLVVLLIAVIAFGVLAKRINAPYPVAFVIGGAVLALIPNLPHPPQLDPQLIFLIALPPLLYAGGWSTDWFEFKRQRRAILLLAIGLVLFTTALVALIAHNLIGLSWPLAFVLGAIVSPPDAVAAEAVFDQLAVPRRIVAILTGEGLVNDATALTLYRFAVVAAVTGAFSLSHATASFFIIAIGGLVIGFLSSFLVELVLHFLSSHNLQDSTLTTIIVLLAPFGAYLPAEELHVSGVLATVSAGIYMGRRVTLLFDSEERVLGSNVWRILIFLLNAMVFLLIGLQLPAIVKSLTASPTHFALDALIVTIAVIVIRILWIFPLTYLTRWLIPAVRKNDPAPWQQTAFISWTGMRGIVSLAAALALPYTDRNGHPLAGRAEIVFITFCVIFGTLVVQGFSLAPLIAWLGISETSSRQRQETQLRIEALESAVNHLHALEPTFTTTREWEVEGRILGEYANRIEHLKGHLDDEAAGGASSESAIDHRLQKEALDAERRTISARRRAGQIPDDIYRAIEYDLDLADLRLA